MLEEWQTTPHGRMAIQAGKSVTSCPQLVSVPLTGLERMLSSSLNMALSLPTSKGFTCLTAIIAVVVELARHFTMPRSVFSQCLDIRRSQCQTSNKNGRKESLISSSPDIKFAGLSISKRKQRYFSGLPCLQLSSEMKQEAPNYLTFPLLPKRKVKQHLKERRLL
ncbi:hypothetical protein AVEN_79876-1 [Araneus ventricosus]|uniref:Uncharacterized protein n=1 Tax=Araneus ventricosus TaxID=182803 RepID=A0A4Y2DSZ1_ARAVE|nr:hypothetical protein AVEN_79876-1 [Araneus ventricosus]